MFSPDNRRVPTPETMSGIDHDRAPDTEGDDDDDDALLDQDLLNDVLKNYVAAVSDASSRVSEAKSSGPKSRQGPDPKPGEAGSGGKDDDGGEEAEFEGWLQELLSCGAGDGSEGPTDDADVETLVRGVMETVLSKDVLYPPLKHLVSGYPDWLADNRSRLDPEEFERRNKQFEAAKRICIKFESGSADGSVEELLTLVQEMQGFGDPPPELLLADNFEPSSSLSNVFEKLLRD